MHNKLLRYDQWYPSSSNTRWFLMIDICHLTSPPLASISKNIFHNLHKYISQFVQRYFKICTNTEWFLMITFLSWPPHHLVNLDQSRINWKSIPEISNRSKKVQLTHTAALNFQIQSEYLLKLFVFPLNDFVVIFVEKCLNWETKTNIHVIWKSVWIRRHWYWEISYSMKWNELVYSQDYTGGGGEIPPLRDIYVNTSVSSH